MSFGVECRFSPGRFQRFEAEDLDVSAGRLGEKQAGPDNPGIVENEEAVLRDVFRKVPENVFGY
jgi:hypothetical protein